MLAQHGDECGEHGDCETRIHETGDRENLARRAFLDRWNDGGLTGDGGVIEREEDNSEEGRRLFVRVGLEVRMDVDDKGGADSGGQTGLQEQVRWSRRAVVSDARKSGRC